MTMTDPVADYLTRLRNALQAKHKRVDIPVSNLKRELTKLLLEHKFVAGLHRVQRRCPGYSAHPAQILNDASVITGLKRVSRPGLRQYVGCRVDPPCAGRPWHRHHLHVARSHDRSPGA